MDINEYQKSGQALYEDLCKTIARILNNIFSSNLDYKPQHIPYRAKSLSSLKKRLEKIGKGSASNIEELRKDLGGCRIIFYTNNDVSRFINSGILKDNFEIDWERSKFHHPKQNENNVTDLFVSNNYVVKLKDDRTKLAEYAIYDGLWCEIQVQTTLNHVWAELGHDIIYKTPEFSNFAKSDMDSIESRLGDVMRKHIVPAGYIFQKIKSDVARLAAGKNLFDTNIMNEIIKAPDNNERYSLIERLKNDVLPHYDDIKTELPDIYEKLASVWLKTETTPIIPHETPYGNYAGKTPSQVTKIIVEIFERYKYLNIEKLYAIVRNLYLVNKGQDSKLQLCELIANLAKYNIHILNKYGIFVQLELLSLVSKETGNELANLAPLLSKILGEIVKPDVSGTTNTSDTVTFHSGHVPINEEIIKLRKKSIKLLGAYTKMIADDKDKRVNLVLLTNAFRMPQVANYSDDVAVMIMSDAVDVIQLFAEIAGNSNFELKQYLEAELFRIYCNYQTLPKQIKENAKIVEIRKKLLLAIEDARAVFEADEEYIIYKTLVGYESVFSLTWDRGTFDYKADKEFRESESQRYADNINRSNWKKWIVRLEQCAATQSNDHATFPPLIDFVNRVAKSKPELVLELLQNYSASLERLVPSIIFHLLIGNLRYEVITILNSWINEGRDVENIAYAHRLLEKPDKDLVKSLVKRVLADKNETAALALMESAVRRYKELPEFWKNEVFFPCLELLRNKKNLNWVHATWFIARGNSLFSQLNLEESKTVLSALIPVASVEYEVEFILVAIASNHANLVLDWFGERLLFSREDIDYHYEAIPFSLTHLRDHLTADPAVIINKIHGWLVKAPRNYEFHVNRFLSKLYSKFDDGLERELLLYIEGADVEKILFITKILTGFEGKPFLNSICKVAISNSLCDEIVRRQVSSIILETGVLSGEYGFAEARAEKKRQLSDWLTDEDKNIKDFAKNLFHRMDLEIASDRRRAEEQIALRKLEYGEDIVSKNE